MPCPCRRASRTGSASIVTAATADCPVERQSAARIVCFGSVLDECGIRHFTLPQGAPAMAVSRTSSAGSVDSHQRVQGDNPLAGRIDDHRVEVDLAQSRLGQHDRTDRADQLGQRDNIERG